MAHINNADQVLPRKDEAGSKESPRRNDKPTIDGIAAAMERRSNSHRQKRSLTIRIVDADQKDAARSKESPVQQQPRSSNKAPMMERVDTESFEY
jgi:hypothetical protein